MSFLPIIHSRKTIQHFFLTCELHTTLPGVVISTYLKFRVVNQFLNVKQPLMLQATQPLRYSSHWFNRVNKHIKCAIKNMSALASTRYLG